MPFSVECQIRDRSLQECAQQQIELSSKAIWHDSLPAQITKVGGLDISFFPPSDSLIERAIAVLVICDFPSPIQIVHTVIREITLDLPYIPSYLSFREVPAYQQLLEELPAEFKPDILLVDGNGRLHPRQAGSATVLGVVASIPTIGVAKEFHPLHDMVGEEHLASQKSLHAYCRQKLKNRGDWVPLYQLGDLGEALGAAVLSSPSAASTNPIYVSQGNMVSLITAMDIVLRCCTTARVPEPVRQADLLGREAVRRVVGRTLESSKTV